MIRGVQKLLVSPILPWAPARPSAHRGLPRRRPVGRNAGFDSFDGCARCITFALLISCGLDQPLAAEGLQAGMIAEGAPADTAVVAERILRIGQLDGDPDLVFSRVVDIAVGEVGRFAVLDRGMSRLRVFDETGRLRFGRGRLGPGPGEFSQDVAGVAFGDDGSVYVLDPGHGRITHFHADGELAGTMRLPRSDEERVLQWQQLRPGTVLEWVRKFAERTNLLRSRTLPDEEVTTVVELAFEEPSDGRSPEEPIELLGLRPLWAPTGDEEVAWAYAGPGTSATVYFTNADGPVDSTEAAGLSARATTSGERIRLHHAAEFAWAQEMGREPESIGFISERFALPDSLPALTGLYPGPSGFLLVQWFEDVGELHGLGLFSYFALPLGGGMWALLDLDEGIKATVAGLDRGFQALAAVGDRIYGIERDEFGVEFVVVYRLDTRHPGGQRDQ